jgi:hypothetical protein
MLQQDTSIGGVLMTALRLHFVTLSAFDSPEDGLP